MKFILIPTDFSSNAFSALQYATQLFSEEPCTFFVLNSFESQVSQLTSRVDIGKTQSVVDELYDEVEANCEKVIASIKEEYNNNHHSFKSIATSLSLFRVVNKLIEKEGIDYVIIGGKGKTAAQDILMGSNALKMIEKIEKVALLIVPENLKYSKVDTIAFATGFKRNYTAKEMHPLVYISELQKASVRVIHMQQEEELETTQRMHYQTLMQHIKDAHPQSNWLETKEGIDKAIANYIDKAKIDMLAMIYYKHNIFVKLFREATVKNLAKKSRVPFLIIPTQ